MLRQIKPRNARSKRALEKKEPKPVENPKTTLFMRGSKASALIQSAMSDLYSLKKPTSIKFTKNNPIHPFEDASSLEFFSNKNDASLIVIGSNSKKRPHCLTLVRTFEYRVLDMLELYLDKESFRNLAQFKNRKCAYGLKPLLLFTGTPFDSPTPNAYTLAKNMLTDLFRGQESSDVDVEGLQYIVCISAGEEGEQGPRVHLRVYLIHTKKSGRKLPRVEVEEMGPRMDFRIGRTKEAEDSAMKEALAKSRHLESKGKKNVQTDVVGDKIGRIHLGRQDLGTLQTRKMKGLKRQRGVEVEEDDHDEIEFIDDEDEDEDEPVENVPKKSRIA